MQCALLLISDELLRPIDELLRPVERARMDWQSQISHLLGRTDRPLTCLDGLTDLSPAWVD